MLDVTVIVGIALLLVAIVMIVAWMERKHENDRLETRVLQLEQVIQSQGRRLFALERKGRVTGDGERG